MQKSVYLYLSIIVVCVLIISTSVYYGLGGFEKTEIFFFEGTTRGVIGREHLIPNDRKTYFEKMDSARMDLQNGKLKGNLTSIIYNNSHLEGDSIRCFIGAFQDGVSGVVRMPAGFEFRQFKTDRIYKIFLTQHLIVRPTPGKIEEILEVKSIEEGELLQPFTFEIYYEDNSMSIEKWVK